MLLVLAGDLGLTVVGTTFSALTVNLRLREIMLPMLVYPVLIPCLHGRHATHHTVIAGSRSKGDQLAWLRLLIASISSLLRLAVLLIDTVLIG
jgi:heme exporter protein B